MDTPFEFEQDSANAVLLLDRKIILLALFLLPIVPVEKKTEPFLPGSVFLCLEFA